MQIARQWSLTTRCFSVQGPGAPLIILTPPLNPYTPPTPSPNSYLRCTDLKAGTFLSRRFTELCSGCEVGSHLRLIDFCITRLEGKEEEEDILTPLPYNRQTQTNWTNPTRIASSAGQVRPQSDCPNPYTHPGVPWTALTPEPEAPNPNPQTSILKP